MMIKSGSAAHKRLANVLFEGEPVKEFTWAKSGLNGEIEVPIRDRKGNLVLNKRGDGYVVKMIGGKVEFVKK